MWEGLAGQSKQLPSFPLKSGRSQCLMLRKQKLTRWGAWDCHVQRGFSQVNCIIPPCGSCRECYVANWSDLERTHIAIWLVGVHPKTCMTFEFSFLLLSSPSVSLCVRVCVCLCRRCWGFAPSWVVRKVIWITSNQSSPVNLSTGLIPVKHSNTIKRTGTLRLQQLWKKVSSQCLILSCFHKVKMGNG